MFAIRCVTAPIPLFVSLEVGAIDTLRFLGLLAAVWLRAPIALVWIEMVIHFAAEVVRAMKPWANSNEDASGKPFWTIVAGRSTVIRSDVIVAVRAIRGYADLHGDLCICRRGGCRKKNSGKCR
jgi:hypothetical protein